MASREFRLPDLGEGLEDAEVARWLVAEGDEVALNQPLVEVDTAKALVEIPSPVAGRVATLHVGEGEVVKVGARLVTFEVSEEEGETGRRAVLVGYGVEEGAEPVRRRRLRPPAAGKAPEKVPASGGRPAAAPPVRKLAAELGVDLGMVAGSGPGGRITREDVLGAAGPVTGGPEERIPVRGVRRIVADRMSTSVRTIPHVTTFLTVDAASLLEIRRTAESMTDVRVTPLAVVARAFIEVCKAHPKLNASWEEETKEIVLKRYYHLGVATDTERGLVVPVVRDVHRRSVVEVAEEIARLSALVREGAAGPHDLSGSTVTISNVGSFGAEFGTPLINPPESAILALGLVEERAVVFEGAVSVRPTVTLSLSFDHRIADGAEAGRALLDLKRLLQDPEALTALLQAPG